MLVSTVLKLLLPLLTIIVSCSAGDTGTSMTDARKPLVKRSVEFQRLRRPRNRLARIRHNLMQHNISWSQFTPPTPSPEDVECQIREDVVRFYAGRCVRLGGSTNPVACQAGVHVTFQSPTCSDIVQRRQGAQATPGPNPFQGSQSGSIGP